MNRRNFGLLCTGAMLLPVAAHAQSTPAPGSDSGSSRSQTSTTPAGSTNNPSDGIGDIVVTATRREERLQDVPVSVTALSGSQLSQSNIASTSDFTQAVPALTLTRQTASATPGIRGVVSTGTGFDEPSVSFYLDGVYQPIATGNVFSLLAIDRIEVLRGPQGTLFGRNSMGGLINVITRTPSFKPEGEASISYGGFSEWTGRAYASTGITDNLAMSIALTGSRNSGFDKDLLRAGNVGQQKSLIARWKALFEPTDNVKITGEAFYNYNRDDSVATGNPVNQNTQARGLTPSVILPTGPNQFAGDMLPLLAAKKIEANLLSEVNLGSVTLNTAGSYQHDSLAQRQDNDGSPVFIRYAIQNLKSDTFSQEIRLSSTSSGRFQWIAGVYFFDFRGSGGPISAVTPKAATTFEPSLSSVSEAVFAEGTYRVTPKLKFTVGGRYTFEQRREKQIQSGKFLFDAHTSFENFSPRGIVEYEITPKTNVYASVSTGFKSGGYATTGSTPVPVRPEKLLAYEVGIKSDPLNWLRVNAAAYYYDYKDLQATARSADGLILLLNAAKARIYGGELEVTARASSDLSFRLQGSYIHGRYLSFPGAVDYVPLPAGGNSQIIADASGKRIVRTPEFSGSIGANYNHTFDAGTLSGGMSLTYSGRVYYDFLGRVSQKPYSLFNANVSWTFSNQFTVSLWGNNLFDTRYLSSVDVGALADLGYYQKPRSYGVTVSKKF